MPRFIQKPLVFVLEDDASQLEIVCAYLQQLGYETAGFSAARLLLAGLDGRDPFAVVTDLDLPGMDGHTLALKIMDRNPNVPIIVLSGRSEGRDLGYAQAVIPKNTHALAALKAALEELAPHRGDARSN